MVAVGLATPAARDEMHWQWAAHRDDAGAYASYLTAWPQGRHVDEGRQRQDRLAWDAATAADTMRAFAEYVATSDSGAFLEDASRRIESLRADDGVYTAAIEPGTEEALQKFLTDFPGHAREPDARTALADITEGRDIVDLLEEKRIEIETQGAGIQEVRVRLRRLGPSPLTVRIPVGSYFVSARRAAQNMVTTQERRVRLQTHDWQTVSVAAACANRPRQIPGAADHFAVRRSPQQAELARLMPAIDKEKVPYAVRQAAVWIVTDNASYGDLGVLVRRSQFQQYGGSRLIREAEAARAMRLCDRAGIDLRRKAIWRDRQHIAQGLESGDLKSWLAGTK